MSGGAGPLAPPPGSVLVSRSMANQRLSDKPVDLHLFESLQLEFIF